MSTFMRRLQMMVGLALIVTILREPNTSGHLWASILAGVGCGLVAISVIP